MNTKQILIIGAVVVGGYLLWKKYGKDDTTAITPVDDKSADALAN